MREPVKSYSSGMRARLAFAISMVIEFDCFLIDEIIAVGDARFHEKCNHELFVKRGDRAMIIVSHNAAYIREHCTRARGAERRASFTTTPISTKRSHSTTRNGIGGMRRAVELGWRVRRGCGVIVGIHAIQPSRRRPRLLVDVSAIIRHDAQTGIQRVVRAVWSELLQPARTGFRGAAGLRDDSHGYCYAPIDFLRGPSASR